MSFVGPTSVQLGMGSSMRNGGVKKVVPPEIMVGMSRTLGGAQTISVEKSVCVHLSAPSKGRGGKSTRTKKKKHPKQKSLRRQKFARTFRKCSCKRAVLLVFWVGFGL